VELPEQWQELIIVPICKGENTDYTNYLSRHITFVNYIQSLSNILLSMLTPSAEEIIADHDFDATSELLVIYSAFTKYFRHSGNTMKLCINYLYTSRKPMLQLGQRCCIIFQFGIPMKLVTLIKMYLNGT
jgi:hypothetical protein